MGGTGTAHGGRVRLPGRGSVRRRWALARRSLSKPKELAYFLAYAPRETVVADLVRIAGMR
ncbi:IS701 family transposase, partial [Streptomyces sp. DSM 41524]|nr:IS701 family transposase [Streptomyces sp. DSM 41524]